MQKRIAAMHGCVSCADRGCFANPGCCGTFARSVNGNSSLGLGRQNFQAQAQVQVQVPGLVALVRARVLLRLPRGYRDVAAWVLSSFAVLPWLDVGVRFLGVGS